MTKARRQSHSKNDDLERNIRLLEMAANAAKIGTWEYDVEEDELWWSNMTHTILGTSAESYKPSFASFIKFYSPEHQDTVKRSFEQLQLTETSFDIDVNVLRSTGEAILVRLTAQVCETDGNKRISGLLQDLSIYHTQLEVRDTLPIDAKTTHNAFDDAAIVAITDIHGIITYANRKFEAISGYTRQELIGNTHSVINSRTHSPKFWSDFWKTLAAGKTWRGEICNRAKDGSLYWVDSTVIPLKNSDGKTHSYMAVRFDVTSRKQLEETVRANARFSELLMNTAPVGIFRLDSEANCSYVNDYWCQMTGFTADQAKGDGWINALHPDDKYKVFQSWGDMVTGAAVFEHTFRFQKPDGATCWARCLATPVRNEAGRIQSYLAAAVDITKEIDAQKTMESSQKQLLILNDELQTKAQELEKASATKSMFLANMSHELRTPLNGIMGMAQILERSNLQNDQREVLRDIVFSGETLLALINDLLDFTKIEAGSMSVEHSDFDLLNTINRTLDVIKPQANQKNIPVTLNINPKVPQYIVGDSLRIRQILLNFLSNAVKFTRTGGVYVTVSHTRASASRSDVVTISVKDSGIGIAPELVSKLFKPFTQADASTTRRFGGTGLGLAISKRLAQLMGGDVTLESTVGEGSTFSFHFETKLASAKIIREFECVQDEPTPISQPIRKSEELKILVAEDNATNQRVVMRFLQRLGVTPQLANNGEEAAHIAQQEMFDVILMDLQMPVMGGIEATKAIRANNGPNAHTWISAMTANAFEEDKKLCFEAGMNDFISKPVRFEVFEKLIKTLVHSKLVHTTKIAG